MDSSQQNAPSSGIVSRLRTARERLEAKDLQGAVAIYEEVLAASGDRADVLVTISGDLGSTGHVSTLIELIAPRYDAVRHGPAVGFNLLQAYLGTGEAGPAQHVLDLLFDLKRPDLEERLYGFSNAISELLLAETTGAPRILPPVAEEALPPAAAKVGIVTISKPLWFYGLEPMADRVLPAKAEGKTRRVAFAQLSIPGASVEAMDDVRMAGSETAFLAYAFPAWFAEIFTFSPSYVPYAAVAFVDRPDGTRHPMVFSSDWSTENLRNLVDTTSGGLDYVFTGSLKHRAGDYELTLRLWEVKKFRERKQFTARWTPGNVDGEIARLRDQVCQFMEWTAYPAGQGAPYAAPASPREWLEVMGSSLNLFLAEKGLVPKELMPSLEGACKALQKAAPTGVVPSLAWLTLKRRATTLGLPLPKPEPALKSDPLVDEARSLTG